MEFLEHAIAWCKGEIFEGRVVLICGLLLLVCAYLFFKFGTTTYAKEIILPLVLLAILFTSAGISMNFSNEKRIEKFSVEYKISKDRFIEKEKKRVENFMTWYPKVKASMSIIITLAVLAYLFGGVRVQSFALVFILMGLSGLVIDHFSKERAQIYYKQILKSEN